MPMWTVAHIATLLLTFFSRRMRPLLEQGICLFGDAPFVTTVRVSGVKPRNIAGPINKVISSA